VTWKEWYRSELQAARGRADGGAYAKGLQRGFEGPQVVADPEHDLLSQHPDLQTSLAYRDGLLEGMNLKVWAHWFGPPLPARDLDSPVSGV
jgi:hypothetical protein